MPLLTNHLKEKMFLNGYNLVGIYYFTSSQSTCVCVYMLDSNVNNFQGVIFPVEGSNILNDALLTCTKGCKIKNPEITKSIFPNLENDIKRFKKLYPNHFK